MAYRTNKPLNNRSGIGGKEKMQREEAVDRAREQEELEEKREHNTDVVDKARE